MKTSGAKASKSNEILILSECSQYTLIT